MQGTQKILAIFSMFCAVIVVGGCSNSNSDLMPFTIKATLKNKPLSNGTVSLEPLEGQDTRSGGPVENGECKIDRKNGLKPGKYLVRFTAGDGKTPNDADAAGPGGGTNIVSKDLIPADYGFNSKQEVTIKKDGDNVFEFKIP